MNDFYSTLSGWLIPISRAMEANGFEVEKVLAQFDIVPQDNFDQESRVATDKISDLIVYCNKSLKRHDFTIEVAKHFHPGMFHALGYAMFSSSCLRNALERIARYKRVVSNTCTLELVNKDNLLLFEMHIDRYEDSGRLALDHHLVEIFLATIVQFTRQLLGKHIKPVRVEFTQPSPQFDYNFLTEFFGCPIFFGREANCLVLEREITDTQLIGANPLITQTHEKILDELLCRINKDDLINRVKNRIYEELPLGAPSQIDIASYLGMSLRSLQRKLQDKDTNYKELLEQTRKKLALEYIRQKHLSLSEISYLVGFSSVGNFNRAFKRWTNSTPGEYRANL